MPTSRHRVSLVANGTTVSATTGAPATMGALRQSATGMASLAAGDLLSLLHRGTAQFEFGSEKRRSSPFCYNSL
jgi:hypothetical protein